MNHKNTESNKSGLASTQSGKSLKAIIRITDRCNQDCSYCYVDRETRRSSKVKLSLQSLSHLYSEILSGQHFNHVHIIWHGGEPTLVGHEYLDAAISLQLKYLGEGVEVNNSIQTNTTALDDRMLEVFKKHSVGVGISLDAPPDVHNKMRVSWSGHSTLERVLSQIETMRSHGLKFGAICVLHKQNYKRCDEIYDFFKAVGLNYQFNPFYRDEATPLSTTDELCITPEQYAEALIQTFNRYISDPSPTISVTDLKEIVLSMFMGCSRSCLFAGKCEEFIGILPTGEIYLCDMFYREDFRVGNIDSITAKSIIDSAAVKVIQTRPTVLQQTYCKGCEWWNICRGGCSSKSAAVYGDALREDPFCLSRKELFAHIRSSMNKLGGKEVIQHARTSRDDSLRISPCGTI